MEDGDYTRPADAAEAIATEFTEPPSEPEPPGVEEEREDDHGWIPA